MTRLIIFINIVIIYNISAQDNINTFPSNLEDSLRWSHYENYIQESKDNDRIKANKIYKFALAEYEFRQFQKLRTLCELSNELNPKSPDTHILLGKAYASSGDFCKKGITGEIVWVAYDEWQIAIDLGGDPQYLSRLIKLYSNYLPTGESLHNCFGKDYAKEGDKHWVGCWIQRKTTIRLKKQQ